MTIPTVTVASLKKYKNIVIGNPVAKVQLVRDELFVTTWAFSFFQNLFCSPLSRHQSYWLPQPCRHCINTVKSSSGCFAYRSSPCCRFFIIWSVSEFILQWQVVYTVIFFRLRRGPQYTFESEHTPCHFLWQFLISQRQTLRFFVRHSHALCERWLHPSLT